MGEGEIASSSSYASSSTPSQPHQPDHLSSPPSQATSQSTPTVIASISTPSTKPRTQLHLSPKPHSSSSSRLLLHDRQLLQARSLAGGSSSKMSLGLSRCKPGASYATAPHHLHPFLKRFQFGFSITQRDLQTKNMIIKIHSYVGFRWMMLCRNYCSSEATRHIVDPTKTICKIMMSCPTSALDTALDQSGVRISPEIVEDVLVRFNNAGLVAYRFFEWAGKQRKYTHSVKVYHAMIDSLAKIRQYQIMWEIVNSMRSRRMQNMETFGIIMRKYARAQKVEEALYTFNVMEKYDCAPNLAAFNDLLSALCKSKNVRKAQEIFDKMKDRFEPDSKTYSILIDGWGKDPNLPKAREVFREMVDAGCSPDIVTYGIMVAVLCKAGRVDETIEIVRAMDANGCMPTSFIYSILVHTYGVEGRIEDAVDAFLEMERYGIKADVAVYNALIGAFCKANKFKNVYRVLNDMKSKDVTPNSRTCNIILSSLIEHGETDEAFSVFRKMIKVCDPDADTYTMMMQMFCERNELEMALKVWKYMKLKGFVPSMHTYSVLINSFCGKGNASKACVLLEEMIEKGIRPSGATFGRLRQLLIKDGREDVLKFLQEKINLLVKDPLFD